MSDINWSPKIKDYQNYQIKIFIIILNKWIWSWYLLNSKDEYKLIDLIWNNFNF